MLKVLKYWCKYYYGDFNFIDISMDMLTLMDIFISIKNIKII